MLPKSSLTTSENFSISSADAVVSPSSSQQVQATASSSAATDNIARSKVLLGSGTRLKKSKRAFADGTVDWERLNTVVLAGGETKDTKNLQRIRLHTVVSSKNNRTLSTSNLSRSDDTGSSSTPSVSTTTRDEYGNKLLHLSTRSFIAAVSCVGVLLVLLLTIVAADMWGLHVATAAIHQVQSEATQTLLEAMRLDLRPLDDFMIVIGSPYFMYSELRARQNMSDPVVQETARVALTTIMSQQLFAEHVAFIQIGEFSPYDRWRAVVIAASKSGDDLYAAMENGFESTPVDVRRCLPRKRMLAEPASGQLRLRVSMDDLMTGQHSVSRMLAPWGLSFSQNNDSLMADPLKVFPTFYSDEIENITAAAVRVNASEDPLSCDVYNATRLYRRIFNFNYSFYYAPMDMIVPFVTQEGYGFLEASIRWETFSGNAVLMHRHIFDKHGEFALLSSGFVVVKSWEQEYRKSPHQYALPVPLHAISNPLMNATMHLLEKYEGEKEEWKKSVHIYKFKYNGDLATARVFSFSHKGDQEFVFVATALDKYTLNPIYERKTKTVMLFASVFAAFTLLAFTTAGIVKEDLYKLKPFLKQCSTLQFASLPPIEPSLFLELQHIQSAFVALQRQLMSLKTYIPGPLLIMTSCSSNDNSDVDEDALGDSWTSGVESDDQQDEPDKDDALKQDPMLNFANNRWRRGYHLNTKIFKEKLNVFHRRHCTVLWLCRFYTNDVSTFDMDSLFRAAHIGSLNFNGCFEFMRPDYIVLSFGAHTPLLMHASRASECASFIWNQLSPNEQVQVNIFVDTAEFLVGTCGVEGVRRSRVVFDIYHLMELGSIFRVQNTNGVLATPTTASQLTGYLCIPVVRAHLSQTTTPYIVFEIRQIPPYACPNATAKLSKRFRSAFHYMCEGRYGDAAQVYRQIGVEDLTAKRLLQVCQTYIAAKRTDGYLLYSAHSCMQFFGYLFKSKYFRLFNIVAALYILRNYHLLLQHLTKAQASEQRSGQQPPSTSAPLTTTTAATATTTPTDISTAAPAVPSAATPTATAAAQNLTEPHVSFEDPTDAFEGSRSLVEENLVELLNVYSSTSSITSEGGEHQPTQSMSSASILSSIPAVIVDENNQRWMRSRELIGKGAFAVAYKGMSEDGVQVALKCMQVRRKRSHLLNLQSEVRMFAQLRHPNIVQYISSKMTSDYVCIVMEYAPGGSLYDLLQIFGSFNAQTIKPFTQATLGGLSYLHSRGITHCDVKPHNMLLGVGGVCKLSDFGSAMQVDVADQDELYKELELRGTAVYMAPEVAKGETCTAASDIFSLGVSLLELVTGRLPWVWSITAAPSRDIKSMHALYHNSARFVQCLGRGDIRVEVPSSLDSEIAAFCKACCHINPARRPNAQELMAFPYLL